MSRRHVTYTTVPGATVRVMRAGGSVKETLYAASSGSTQVANPMVAGQDGTVSAYVEGSDLVDLLVVVPAADPYSVTDVFVGSAGGGGAAPAVVGWYDSGNGGNGFSVPASTTAAAPWAESGGTPGHPLDLTDPLAPTVTADGVYAFSVLFNPDATPSIQAPLDLSFDGRFVDNAIHPAGVTNGAGVSLSAVRHLLAGAVVTADIFNPETDAAVWYLTAVVTKIA